MRQLLALLREPPLPGQRAIPYLGDVVTCENVLRIVAKDKTPSTSAASGFPKRQTNRLMKRCADSKQRMWRTGQAMFAVQLGEPSRVGGGGVSVSPVVTPQPPVVQPPPVGPLPTTGGSPYPDTRPSALPANLAAYPRAGACAGAAATCRSPLTRCQVGNQPVGRS